ncbi:TlpA disulfide reductase family protein [Emticicia sp. BO119]|uniref:TlpA family protein disulfide reductase n=1 Tax=Emticicia sp. BO119 TaxID=2757768 RepID=UPI0015F08B35|nr:TlpA disulfide reductase family protein [Emticicia sp. BO119]MBA4851465.1 TlpA family protein disulfide reductase [Emticicia sp. BO119]
MRARLKTFILLSILILPYQLLAQKKFAVKISFPPKANIGSISIRYDNGRDANNELANVIKANQCVIAGEFFSRYATIIISFEADSLFYYSRFWVTEKTATIRFVNRGEKKLTDAIDLKTVEAEKFTAYVSVEQKDLDDFYEENFKKIADNDSLRYLYSQKIDQLQQKQLAFVKANNKDYYSLWLYRDLIYTDNSLDSLNAIYRAFPDSLKNTYEGKTIERVLYSRTIKSGVKAPDFITRDIKGRALSLADFKGKYLLLNFWASWCEPCIAELPAIKLIHDTYASNQLEILAVTQDTKYKAFETAVKKYNMNWLHVFRDMELFKSYGDMSLPKVFLIDPTGTIIYVRDEQNDIDLSLLTKLMSEELKK